MSERILKPCPFCGELPNTWTEEGETLMAGHATVWHAGVACPNNCAEMRDEDPDGVEAMNLAIEAWDRRAPEDAGDAVSRLSSDLQEARAELERARGEQRNLERIKREWSAACDVISDNGCDCECDCQDLHENDHECDASKNDELCVPCRICDAMKKAGAHD